MTMTGQPEGLEQQLARRAQGHRADHRRRPESGLHPAGAATASPLPDHRHVLHDRHRGAGLPGRGARGGRRRAPDREPHLDPPEPAAAGPGAGHRADEPGRGRVPDLFRAPYGAWSPFVLAQCARTGMTPLGWSVDPRDWSRPGVPSIVTNIMRNTHTGSIILEHDGGGNRAQTVAALKIVIPRLLAAGYHFRAP